MTENNYVYDFDGNKIVRGSDMHAVYQMNLYFMAFMEMFQAKITFTGDGVYHCECEKKWEYCYTLSEVVIWFMKQIS